MYKQRCIMVLKKRKMYDNQLKNYMSQQMTLDQVAFTSESIQNTIDMVQHQFNSGYDDEGCGVEPEEHHGRTRYRQIG